MRELALAKLQDAGSFRSILATRLLRSARSVRVGARPAEPRSLVISVVLMEFPDADSARAWYQSPAYQPLKAIRHRAARNAAVLIEG